MKLFWHFFCKNGMSNIGPVLSVFTRHARMDVTKVEFSDLHYLSRYIKQFPSWKVFLRDNQSKTLGLVCLLIGIGFIIVFIYCILTKSSIKISLNSYNYTYVTVAHKLNITGYMGPVILPTSYYVYLLQTTFQSICCPDYTLSVKVSTNDVPLIRPTSVVIRVWKFQSSVEDGDGRD